MTPALQAEATIAHLGDNGAGRRLALTLVLGLAVAAALTWVMYVLIDSGEVQLVEGDRSQLLDYVRIPREEASQRRERLPERPDTAKAPPTPASPQTQSLADGLGDGALLVMAAPTLTESVTSGTGISLGFGDGEYLPIVKVAPIYPATAMRRGLEGECLVEYTVTTTGAVENVRVIPEACPHEEFHRPSVEAALRFKYRPRMLNGHAIEVRGVRNVFVYTIDR